MHFPSFHSFSWSSRISVDSASFLSVASSMFASREMDLREVGKAADEVHHLNFAFTKKKKKTPHS